MKAIRLRSIVEFSTTDNIYDANNYEGIEGLYVVDDGVVYTLMQKTNDTMIILAVLPRDSIFVDVQDRGKESLQALHKKVDTMRVLVESINSRVDRSNGGDVVEGIDSDTLLKALALAQDPSLIKDI